MIPQIPNEIRDTCQLSVFIYEKSLHGSLCPTDGVAHERARVVAAGRRRRREGQKAAEVRPGRGEAASPAQIPLLVGQHHVLVRGRLDLPQTGEHQYDSDDVHRAQRLKAVVRPGERRRGLHM